MSKGERRRRTLTAALARHMVGAEGFVRILSEVEGWIYVREDPNDVKMIDFAVRQRLYVELLV